MMSTRMPNTPYPFYLNHDSGMETDDATARVLLVSFQSNLENAMETQKMSARMPFIHSFH
eukprot:1157930-Pelagomonas_calceolata.AAC.11